MLIYKINQQNRYFEGTLEVPDDPNNIYGIPYGTTRKPTPILEEGQYAVWNGSGWDIVTTPPPEEIVIPPPTTIKVNAFYDRLGEAKYDILLSTNPEVQGYVQQIQNSQYVDLNDPNIINIVNRLVELEFNIDSTVVLNPIINPNEVYII